MRARGEYIAVPEATHVAYGQNINFADRMISRYLRIQPLS
jgi:hypothetical protein